MDACPARHFGSALIVSLVILTGAAERARAQDKNQGVTKDEPKLGWSNSTDLSLVVTGGNSDSATLGFNNKLRHVRRNDRFELEINLLRANKSDDRYFLVEPGLEFPVGGAPADPATTLIRPDPTLDAANSLIRAEYERDISPKVFWNTGASWYRNDDAGILNRYIVFGGIGNKWVDNERRRFSTSYGISYTDREEEKPDPEKERRFAGARAGWDYTEHFNAGTTFDSDFAWNLNVKDPADYSLSTLNALSVSITSRVLLKVSLQWLYENEPALESDLDVIAFVEVLNPDGIPGSGDERFRTLGSGGTKLVLGSQDARKNRLDTVIQTALAIKFGPAK
jgi:hypothetical protein